MKRQLVIVLDAPVAHCGSQGAACKHYNAGPGRSCGLFGGLLDPKVEGGSPYPRRLAECHDAEYRLRHERELAEQKGEERMRAEFAAAISSLEAMKSERDQARKELADERDRRGELAQGYRRVSLRLRDLENELRERGVDW
jgi:hypothetical protein